MMEGQQRAETLKRELKDHYIHLIALGVTIGTSLFLGIAQILGIAQTIQMAGLSVILGYAIGGVPRLFYHNHTPAGRDGGGRVSGPLVQPLSLFF